ncbi:hypothetical protein BH23CHL8_BH23CHL8_27080 [soil metagenome]
MRYLINEAILRLIKAALALVLAILLYWLLTGPLGEPGGVLLALACWLSAATLVLLLETGIV